MAADKGPAAVAAAGPDSGLIEQFAGFFQLEGVTPDEVRTRLLDPGEYWGWPNGVAVATQVAKQADVARLDPAELPGPLARPVAAVSETADGAEIEGDADNEPPGPGQSPRANRDGCARRVRGRPRSLTF